MSDNITLKMENIREDIEKQFSNLYCKKDFTYQLKKVKKMPADQKPREIKKLVEMFRDVGIKCESGKRISYYENLLSSLTVADTVDEVNDKLVNMLFDLSSKYPRPQDYMERIVDRLDPETALSGSLELRILRKFLKTINVVGNPNFYSSKLEKKVNVSGIEAVDETIFDNYSNTNIINAAKTLAHGIFTSPGTTKELLFLFAFAYDMRYYYSKTQLDYNENRDVEKNLFVDYYSDNLTRFLVSQNGLGEGTSDNEPSGIVINPKNFIDSLFVYYLNKDWTPEKKVTSFYSKVDEVKRYMEKEEYQFDVQGVTKFNEIAVTQEYFQKLRRIETIDEKDILKYILSDNKYYCDLHRLYNVKKDEYHTEPENFGSYIRCDVAGTLRLSDNVCIEKIGDKDVLLAIKVKTEKQATVYRDVLHNTLTNDVVGSEFFAYDEKKKMYGVVDGITIPYILIGDGIYVHETHKNHAVLDDHISIGKVDGQDAILAIEVYTSNNAANYAKVERNMLDSKILGAKYFRFDNVKNAYVTRKNFRNPYIEIDGRYYVYLEDHSFVQEYNGKDILLAIETLNHDQNIKFKCEKLRDDISGIQYFKYDEKRKAYSPKSGVEKLYVLQNDNIYVHKDAGSILKKSVLDDHIRIEEINDKNTIVAIEVKNENNKHDYGKVLKNRLESNVTESKFFSYHNGNKGYIAKKNVKYPYISVADMYYVYMNNHVFTRKHNGTDTLLAIETLKRIDDYDEETLCEEVRGSEYFEYNYKKKAYVPKTGAENHYELQKNGIYVYNDIVHILESSVLDDHICIEEIGGQNVVVAIEVINEKNRASYLKVRENKFRLDLEGSEYFKYEEDGYCYDESMKFQSVLSNETATRYIGIFEFDSLLRLNTPYKEYLSILELIREELGFGYDMGFSAKFDFVEALSVDGRALSKESISDKVSDRVNFNKNWIDNYYSKAFLELEGHIPVLKGNVSNLMLDLTKHKLNPKKILTVTDPGKMTRTKLIGAYYHFFILLNTQDNNGMWKSFKDTYEDFKDCISLYLDNAGYQQISSKNLFDMLVIFIAYAKINGFLQ